MRFSTHLHEPRPDVPANRDQASAESKSGRVELHHAQLDDLTGVLTRERGTTSMPNEIDRARRTGEPFVLAFAGDALIQTVVRAMKSKLRNYDPIVRVGGDEFLCGFTNTILETARHRVEEVRSAAAQGADAGTVTVGLAALTPEDTLETLTARADKDMYERKQALHAGRAHVPTYAS